MFGTCFSLYTHPRTYSWSIDQKLWRFAMTNDDTYMTCYPSIVQYTVNYKYAVILNAILQEQYSTRPKGPHRVPCSVSLLHFL